MNLVDGINRYESGEMTDVETVEFFQSLVNTGVAWQLQGHYGRTASWMINEGLVTVGEEEDPYPDYEQCFMMEED